MSFSDEKLQIEDVPDNNVVVEKTEPKITDPEWTEYVLKQFRDDELWNGNPTVDGLRRVAELLLGEIIETAPQKVVEPCAANDNRAVVQWKLRIHWNKDVETPYERVIGDVADAHFTNVDPFFAIYLSAVAATRAEGRALRKALRVKCVAAEEVASSLPDTDDGPAVIQPFQVNSVGIICKRCDINVKRFLKASQHGPFETIHEVPYNIAQKLIIALTAFQKDLSKIPEKLKGYKDDWRGDKK